MLVLPQQTRVSQPQFPVTIRQEYANIIQSATLCSIPLDIGADGKKILTLPFSKFGVVTRKVTKDGVGVTGDGTTDLYL
jgi:hypothetical protein